MHKNQTMQEQINNEKLVNDESIIEDYLRIGTSYYKRVNRPLMSGDSLSILVPWSKECIVDDIGRPTLNKIKRYDGFTCIPSHTSFKQEISGFYNTYQEIPHKPKRCGDIKCSLEFVKHIFGEQYELGLDYLKILYEIPTQITPVLCLVSSERNTGKTTFLNWLKAIYGANMTMNTNSDFRSQFNSDWGSKLIIAVDEVLLDKKEDSERIKALSTSKSIKLEAKGKDKSELEFFGVFILCSNNERSFIRLSPNEIRYWVRKIVPFDKEDTNYLNKLTAEIPAFLSFLLERKFSIPRATRMWFTPEQLYTPALGRLISHNRNSWELELVNTIIEAMDNFELDELQFCIKDLQNLMRNSSCSPSTTQLRNIVRQEWKLIPSVNSFSYKKLTTLNDGSIAETSDKGRFFTLTREFLRDNYDDLMTDNYN